MAVPKRSDATTAAALLELFLQKEWALTEDDMDELFDAMIGLMERARDERYRCIGRSDR